ncbi:MAG: acylphosphatase [Myxococcales bacterium]|nr:acylphosphatase [Myxococcales bacterium]MDH5566480.1 acylphosphatase [Myxococcales bacterium]
MSDEREPARVRRRVVVHGRVQGVWFRASTEQEARRAGLGGWVRNCAGGSVEAVFEGAPDAVERLVQYVHRGPSGARVARVEVHEETPRGEAHFRVRFGGEESPA